MREIEKEEIIDAIADLTYRANYFLPSDIENSLKEAISQEESPLAVEVLKIILENAQIAKKGVYPLCQDCGVAVVFLEIGQDVHITGGNLEEIVNEGIRKGYTQGYLRKSMVKDPVFERMNTGDNTPAVIHTRIIPGEDLIITFAPKGGGSENVSALAMLTPAMGVEGVKEFVLKMVEKAGPNPCPPIIVGVGIGGTSEKAVLLAKEALFRPLGESNPQPQIASLEKELLSSINSLGIGPQGFGGRTTALAVHIETYPCHITSLPVAVNIQCHSARHARIKI